VAGRTRLRCRAGRPNCVDTLAAAYGEAGRFDDAVRTARAAPAAAGPDSGLAAGLRERIALLRVGKVLPNPLSAH